MQSDASTSSRVYSDVRRAFLEYSVMMTLDSSIRGKHSKARADSSSCVGSSRPFLEAHDRWRTNSTFEIALKFSPESGVESVERVWSFARFSLYNSRVSQRDVEACGAYLLSFSIANSLLSRRFLAC